MISSAVCVCLLAAASVALTTPSVPSTLSDAPLAPELLQTSVSSDPEDQEAVFTSALQPTETQLGAVGDDLAMEGLQERESLADFDEAQEGVRFLLAAGFDGSVAGSGKVWMVRGDQRDVLIAGLAEDVGLCLDASHLLLYVFDRRSDGLSRIYQYVLSQSSSSLSLAQATYTVVYEGQAVTSCAVDSLGDLYFAVSGDSQAFIAFANYVDLWGGLKDEYDTLYASEPELVISPSDIAIHRDQDLYWVNGGKEVVRAPGRFHLGRAPEVVETAVSVASDPTQVVTATSDGSIGALNSTAVDTEVRRTKAMCVADGRVYVADAESDELVAIYLRTGEGTVLTAVPGLSDIACVTAWAKALLSTVWLLSLV